MPICNLGGNTMTDYQLLEFARKAQEDARRYYKIYVKYAKYWERHPNDRCAMHDTFIWQRRASIAADHVQEMQRIVTLRGNR